MMRVQPLGERELPAWDEFASHHPEGLIYHNSRYAETLRQWGHEYEVIAASDAAGFIAGSIIHSRPLPMMGWRSGNIEGGVLLRENAPELLDEFLGGLIEYLSGRSYVDIRLYMHMPRRVGDAPEIKGHVRLGEAIERRGGRRDVNTIGTYIVRIDRDEDAILESLSKNTRRDVRKAQREGVTVDDTDDPAVVEMFYDQYAENYRRKGLAVPARAAFVRGHELAMSGGLMRMYRASFGGSVVNMALVSRVGVPRYIRGASLVAAMDSRCPPTGQLLHFEVMKRLKHDGFAAYDLGGSPGPSPIEGHPNYSVWRFKHGFGGEFRQDLGEYYFVLDRMKHKMVSLARGVNERLTSLRAALDE